MAASLPSTSAISTSRQSNQANLDDADASDEEMEDTEPKQPPAHHGRASHKRTHMEDSSGDDEDAMADEERDEQKSISRRRRGTIVPRQAAPKKRRRGTEEESKTRSRDSDTEHASTRERPRTKRMKKRDDGDDEYTPQPSTNRRRQAASRALISTHSSSQRPHTATAQTSRSAVRVSEEEEVRGAVAAVGARATPTSPAESSASTHHKNRLAQVKRVRRPTALSSTSAIVPHPLPDAASPRDSKLSLSQLVSNEGPRSAERVSQVRRVLQQQVCQAAVTDECDADDVVPRSPRPVGFCARLYRRLSTWIWSWVHATMRLVSLCLLLAVTALAVLAVLQWRSEVSREAVFCPSAPTAAQSLPTCELDNTCQQRPRLTTPDKDKSCTRCPAHGLCDSAGRLECDSGYFKEAHICVIDASATRHIAQLKQRALVELHTRAGLYDCAQSRPSNRGMNASDVLAVVGLAHQPDKPKDIQLDEQRSTLFEWLQADTAHVRTVSKAGLLDRMIGLVRTQTHNSPLHNTYESMRAKRPYWCQLRYTATEQWWPLLCITLALASPFIAWYLVQNCRSLRYIALRLLLMYIIRRVLGSKTHVLLRWLGVPGVGAGSSSQTSQSAFQSRLASFGASALLHAPMGLTAAYQLYRWFG